MAVAFNRLGVMVMKDCSSSQWKVEVWASDDDFRLPRDDRARERVKIAQVIADSRQEAIEKVLLSREVRRRWPGANAVAFKLFHTQ